MHPLIEERREQLQEICARYHVWRLELFGSAARDDFDPTTSDVDFLVEFLPNSTARGMEDYFGLKESLESLYGRPVDLVEERAITNPYFLRSIRHPQGGDMQDHIRTFLYDISQGCRRLTAFTAGKTFADYTSDDLLRSAVERQFEIVGEAISQMLKRDPSLEAVITDAKRIIGFRNLLIHGYASVNNEKVWAILNESVPPLQREADALLQAGDSPAEP